MSDETVNLSPNLMAGCFTGWVLVASPVLQVHGHEGAVRNVDTTISP